MSLRVLLKYKKGYITDFLSHSTFLPKLRHLTLLKLHFVQCPASHCFPHHPLQNVTHDRMNYPSGSGRNRRGHDELPVRADPATTSPPVRPAAAAL